MILSASCRPSSENSSWKHIIWHRLPEICEKYAEPELNLRQSKIYALKVCIIVCMQTTTDKDARVLTQPACLDGNSIKGWESENFYNKNPETFPRRRRWYWWDLLTIDKLPRRRVVHSACDALTFSTLTLNGNSSCEENILIPLSARD